MSKKLLSEAQVRRFQSLASITPLQEMGHHMNEEYKKVNAEGHGKRIHGRRLMTKTRPNGRCTREADDDMDDMGEDEDSDVELDEELVQRFVEAAGTIQEMADALGGAADADDAELAPMDDATPMDDAPPNGRRTVRLMLVMKVKKKKRTFSKRH